MPTYRSITLSLISQYDLLTIPEYAPPISPNDPFSTSPSLVDAHRSIVSVYIPTYPSSQFWLSYSISPPHPPKLLYYFKLYINGNETVNWGCGEGDAYKGKTMFGLYDAGDGDRSKRLIEQRVLCFAHADRSPAQAPGSLNDVMEIKVFRSKGRKRIRPELNLFQGTSSNAKDESRQATKQRMQGDGIESVSQLKCSNKPFWVSDIEPALSTQVSFPQSNHGDITSMHFLILWIGRLLHFGIIIAAGVRNQAAEMKMAIQVNLMIDCLTDQLEILGVISPTPSEESVSIRSHEQKQESVCPRRSDNILASPKPSTLASSASPLAARSIESNTSSPTRSPMTRSSDSSHEEVSGDDADDKLAPSPLRIARPVGSITMSGPSTPPGSSSPSNVPTDIHIPSNLSSREQFTSLIRAHMPIPDPTSFKLDESFADRSRSPPPRSRAGSMSVLKKVVDHAVKRKKGHADGEEGDRSMHSYDDMKNKEHSSYTSNGKGKENEGNTQQGGVSVAQHQDHGKLSKHGRKLNVWEQL